MNIFALNINPQGIAKHYPDIHLRKMMVEYVQLLSNAWPEERAVYKRTHYNHPCSKWVRESRQNYEWLYSLVHSMAWEYFNRFSKRHKSSIAVREMPFNADHLPQIGLTTFPQVMPDQFKCEDAIKANRRYYAFKLKDFRNRKICRFTNC